MQAVKFLRVKVPCPFTRKSNECITEATGWSQCRVVHLHLSVCRSPPCRSSPHVRHPLQNRGCADIVPEHVGLPWEMMKICIIVRWIRHFPPQRWTVHFHIPARSSDVTCEAFLKNQTWRHCIEKKKISIQRGLFVSGLGILNVPSKYYDVIDRIAGMQHGTLAPLVDSCDAVGVLLAYALIVFRSMLGGYALLLFTRLAHFQWW